MTARLLTGIAIAKRRRCAASGTSAIPPSAGNRATTSGSKRQCTRHSMDVPMAVASAALPALGGITKTAGA
jgi:hypothetical protein